MNIETDWFTLGHEEKQYTYTIITTDSNKQLNFLHDRMPVILENGSEKLQRWLDPKRYEWSKELQSLLAPYDGELEVYPVSQEVGKVGHNSPTFIIPVDSKENKSNIANFFAKGATKEIKREEPNMASPVVKTEQPEIEFTKQGFVTNSPKEHGENEKEHISIKREAQEELTDQKPSKKLQSTAANKVQNTKKEKEIPSRKGAGTQRKISATSNNTKSPTKASKSAGTQKITKFFANSS